jgi:di/tricarboxylate transporter
VSGDTVFVFLLIIAAAVAMASNRLRFDIVALLVVLALMLSGVLSVSEALAGFGSPVVILVAGLLVVGDMLDRTGVAASIGDMILKHGGTQETRLLVVIMASAAILGSIMSSTAVVAIFIPIILRVAAETGLNASRFLMPMSYAALISGMLTLIATTPNLVVSEELKVAGYTEFGFFSFTLVGLAVLVVAILYMLTLGRRLIPDAAPGASVSQGMRSLQELWDDYRIDRIHQPLEVMAESPLAGKTIAEMVLESPYEIRVIGVLRQQGGTEERIVMPEAQLVFQPGDMVLAVGSPEHLAQFAQEQSLRAHDPTQRDRKYWLWEMGAASLMIHPESTLIGKSLREAEFRSRYGVHVLGIRHGGEPIVGYEETRLAASDSLLVVGSWSSIRQLQTRHHDYVVMEIPNEQETVVPAYKRMPASLLILAGMVTLSIFNLVPLVAAVLIAVLAAVATRCLTMEDAYRSIHWSNLVLVAGMLPLADALEKTGGTVLIVNTLMNSVGDSGPYVMMSVIFFLTAGVGLFLSNTAAAVLVAPIAIYAAEAQGISPYPLAIAVLIAASAAFVTPVSTPVVTLVVEPGRYAFIDFVKVGVPLLLLAYGVTLLVAPIIFPFTP